MTNRFRLGLCAAMLAWAAAAAQTPQYDLLIRNGHVLDPKNGVDGIMDVAVAGGKIARVAAGIDASSARTVVDATGLHVVPGLIDIHAHVFFGTEKDAYLSNSDTAVPPVESARSKKSPSSTAYRSATPFAAMFARACSTEASLMSKLATRSSGRLATTSAMAVASPVPSSTIPSSPQRSCARYCSSNRQTENP